ncbi:MAG: hypothetical protein ABJA67_07840 [Chthonomonadales bacterium]
MFLARGTTKSWLRALPVLAISATGALGAVSVLQGPAKQTKPTVKPAAKPVAVQAAKPKTPDAGDGSVLVSGPWSKSWTLKAGATVEISVHLDTPSTLPANGRIAAEWSLDPVAAGRLPNPNYSIVEARKPHEFEITNLPGANWRKVLHALDGDVSMIYRAPVDGKYTLQLEPVTDEAWVGDAQVRWREKGSAPMLASLPKVTPWPAGTTAPVSVQVKPVDAADQKEEARTHTIIECKPNDTPEMAQKITLDSGDDIREWNVIGGADDIDFFDNGMVGKAGDNWYRVEYTGSKPALLTAQISIPFQAVAARVRAYRMKPGVTMPIAGGRNGLLPITEYKDGMDPNERVHQQDEEHRSEISRSIKPGETYFLRVEANAPGYQLQLRTLPPGPYTDPVMAIKQGMYTQIGQVDAWLTNRPRGASVERRIRDSGNLLGTMCMSCHTQSGVWGPSVPIQQGYPVENRLNYAHLINVMYECLRPTNELKDCANNTSLAPLDIGDGPAGTRAAGFNIVNLERVHSPLKLHSKQQIRTANYVLVTSDPGGINAAGPGSNIGFVIVNTFSTEILKTSWLKTFDTKYFRALEQKAHQVMDVKAVFTDDIAIRLDYFGRVLPLDTYLAWSAKAFLVEQNLGAKSPSTPDDAKAFVEKIKIQLAADEKRLRAIQNEDGSWGFSPGVSKDKGETFVAGDAISDPSPTALAISGLTSMGYGKDDPNIARGVKALLAMQEPTGRWNKAAQTGFVTTAYALHALARLYPNPIKPGKLIPEAGFWSANRKFRREDYLPKPNESLYAAISRVRELALMGRVDTVDLLIKAARHDSPLVRFWAAVGLGTGHSADAPVTLNTLLGDRTKMVRDAAVWATRQTLLDDHGWFELYGSLQSKNDYVREAAWQTMRIRADMVMPGARVSWTILAALFEKAINTDPHPAVRAWASKAAWEWWIWDPPIRKAVNAAWITMLERPESNVLVEQSNRYASQALFIANGHKANGSREHQYKELAELFEALDKRLTDADPATRTRLAHRLVAVGGTFFQTAGGDGGPGQMGYVTPFSGDMMGHASVIYLNEVIKKSDLTAIRGGLEGATGVPNKELTEWLVNYSLKGPDNMRQLAAGAISDPRVVSLPAIPEQVEPQLAQVKRGAMEPPRRAQISDPIVDLWSKVNWNIPKTEEQQTEFFDLIIPKFDKYVSQRDIDAIVDPAKRAETARDMDANWYLADKLGDVLAVNPDLHLDIVLFKYFPQTIKNPLEAHFWLRNVSWLLKFKGAAEKMGPALGKIKGASTGRGLIVAGLQDPKPPVAQKPDPILTVKDHALQLYLDMLKPDADPRTHKIAVSMAGQTAFKTNPEVLRALAETLPLEKDANLKKLIQNVLKQSSETFMPDLMSALKTEKNATVPMDPAGNPKPSKQQVDDIVYFRDFVIPELSRQKRQDQQSCMGCHGLVGRVPSLYLKPPDEYGYLPVPDLLQDYRTLQGRVNLSNLEKSKILRKPLNIQDGKEDGHQGGRRYNPTDDGYLAIKKWVDQQPEVQKAAGMGWRADLPSNLRRGFLLGSDEVDLPGYRRRVV